MLNIVRVCIACCFEEFYQRNQSINKCGTSNEIENGDMKYRLMIGTNLQFSAAILVYPNIDVPHNVP